MTADDIGELEWQMWCDRLSEGLSRSRISTLVAVASAIYAWAMTPTRRYATRNPRGTAAACGARPWPTHDRKPPGRGSRQRARATGDGRQRARSRSPRVARSSPWNPPGRALRSRARCRARDPGKPYTTSSRARGHDRGTAARAGRADPLLRRVRSPHERRETRPRKPGERARRAPQWARRRRGLRRWRRQRRSHEGLRTERAGRSPRRPRRQARGTKRTRTGHRAPGGDSPPTGPQRRALEAATAVASGALRDRTPLALRGPLRNASFRAPRDHREPCER